jgi:cell division septal protein FtsQ
MANHLAAAPEAAVTRRRGVARRVILVILAILAVWVIVTLWAFFGPTGSSHGGGPTYHVNVTGSP